MLTKGDLEHIKKIIREEVGNESKAIRHHIDEKHLQLRMELKPEIREVGDKVKNLDILVAKNHKEVLSKLKKTSDFLDVDNLKTVKRVQRIEAHLDLTD